MTARDTLAQARQGNPQAIAAILNHFTRPKDIQTSVSIHGDVLRIVFSADRLPNQSVMTGFVQRSIEQLDIDAVKSVQVVGQRTGENPAAWVHELSFNSHEPHEYLESFKEEDDAIDEKRWNESFSRSPDVLAQLAASAMAEYHAGETQELDPETL